MSEIKVLENGVHTPQASAMKELEKQRTRSGKTALVTGGSRGIGRAIVETLAAQGLRVAFTYSTRRESATEVVRSASHHGWTVKAFPMQAENRQTIRDAVNGVKEELGHITILVNNAATSQEKPFDQITDSDWDRIMAVNLRGPFGCCQEVLPHMLGSGWGRIINITSIGGQWGGIQQVHYAASKAGLIGLTRSLARIYSRHGITCNAVSPGLVDTEMTRNELSSPEGLQKVAGIPAGRIGRVDEVAATVAFLAGDQAAHITGQTINVNGGMLFT